MRGPLMVRAPMVRALTALGLVLAVALALAWYSGALAGLEGAILAGQRRVQDVLAGAVRQIKTGQPGAWGALLAVCFGYGVLHAAGPGHGKLLIGGYGMARRVALLRLSALALVASLAQSAVAVAVVYAGVAVLGLTRQEAQGAAERWLAPAGSLAIAAVGLWLFWRGLRGIVGANRVAHSHPHHDAGCGCPHAHGPSPEQAEAVQGWRDAAVLVGGIALRPCSGALFLLILTWQLGIGGAGVAGTFAMGLGTACVTLGVALLAVWAREGALAGLPGQSAARLLPWIEALAGVLIALAALALLHRPL